MDLLEALMVLEWTSGPWSAMAIWQPRPDEYVAAYPAHSPGERLADDDVSWLG